MISKKLVYLSAFFALFILSCDQGKSKNYDTLRTKVLKIPEGRYSGKIHEVTLYVNTSKIGVNNKDSIDKYANFRQPYYITNYDYTTYVNPGDIVIWRGVSITDTLDIVNIERIKHTEGRRYLGKPVIQGNKGYPELVVALIQSDNNPEGLKRKDEHYEIMFTVYRDSVRKKGPFWIDPKLLPDY